MDREKYRRLFVDEARENLSTYSNQLIAMEKADGPGRSDALDAVFRAAHSLKGMAGSMGYDPCTELAHALEDLADLGRQGAELDAGAVDLLLEGGDLLGDMVDAIEAGQDDALDAGDLPARLRARQGELSGGGPAEEEVASSPGEAFAGQEGVVLEVTIDPEEANANVRAFMAHRALCGQEGYQQTHPDVDAIKSGEAQGRFAMLFAPGTDPEALKEAALGQTGVKEAAAGPAEAAAAPAPTEPAPAPAAEPEEAEGEDQVLIVELDQSAQLPQARAFMLHRAVSTLPGWRKTEPPLDDIRRGIVPKWVLRFTFGPGDDAQTAADRVRKEQGVKDARVERAADVRKAEAEPEGRRTDDDRTVRVRTALLDEFIDSVGELLLARSRLRQIALRADVPELGDLVDEIERMTRDLHDRVVAARMTPLLAITERFPPLVRSLARKLEKKVDFSIEGAEIELDRAILDELATPLIHMLRNAVDHGHEGTAARVAAGKPEPMSLTLVASRDRDNVLIELQDDGGGIDPEAVRVRAVERGLIAAEQAKALSDAEAIELVCTPGFTTAAAVSETSGRGVGMDVVKATLEKLGGTLRIRSTLGQGTRFTLRLPLTVAIIQVLVVEAGEEASCVYAIPVGRVDRALDLVPEAVREAHGQTHLVLGDALVPLFDLGASLGFAEKPAQTGEGTAILIGEDEGGRAFRVGAVVGQEEVVVKPLGPPLGDFDFLAGAALLADGRTAYILEPARLGR